MKEAASALLAQIAVARMYARCEDQTESGMEIKIRNRDREELFTRKDPEKSAPTIDGPGTMRNKPCTCGSGVKFKKCCRGKPVPEVSE